MRTRPQVKIKCLDDPTQLLCNSPKQVWWKCPEGPDHDYFTSVRTRTQEGHICPFCSNKKVSVTNSLARVFPELAKEWHPVLNEGLRPEDVTCASSSDPCPAYPPTHPSGLDNLVHLRSPSWSAKCCRVLSSNRSTACVRVRADTATIAAWWRVEDPYVGTMEWKASIAKRTRSLRFMGLLRQRAHGSDPGLAQMQVSTRRIYICARTRSSVLMQMVVSCRLSVPNPCCACVWSDCSAGGSS